MIINTPYNLGDILYLKTDIEQLERMICKIVVQQGLIMYGLALGSTYSEHYDFEITAKKDLMKELGILSNESK